MSKQVKPQRQKARSGKVNFVQELRRSSAASPIPAGKNKSDKYRKRWTIDDAYEEDDDITPWSWT